ncbi:MAG: hypothetical protein QXG17_03945 [Sulfolobales archaeon]
MRFRYCFYVSDGFSVFSDLRGVGGLCPESLGDDHPLDVDPVLPDSKEARGSRLE